MSATSVLALVGSLRTASTNRLLAEAAAELAPEGIVVTSYAGLADLPFYNEEADIEGSVPPAAVAFRAQVAAADAVLLVTPEYNGTMPAVLKNAIDWASRPYGVGALRDKPLAVIGNSLGQYAGVWARDEARKAAGIAGANVLDHDWTVGSFTDQHPRESDAHRQQLTAVLDALAAAATEAPESAAA